MLNVKQGDTILVRLRNVKILATTDGAVIDGKGFRIHEPRRKNE